eukprot:c6542_g1_i2.p1 GENE.c6542_g1_i2~~c6542_g1_i2.p1  ORF type:complete len:466 (+),score=103.96 c6542_g1_i2:627-2024(+)
MLSTNEPRVFKACESTSRHSRRLWSPSRRWWAIRVLLVCPCCSSAALACHPHSTAYSTNSLASNSLEVMLQSICHSTHAYMHAHAITRITCCMADVGDIEVEVLGDVENAPESPALNQDTANLSTLEGDVDDSGDDEPPQKRLRTPSPANLSQQPHPLSVQLVLKDPAGDLAVVFRFHAISQGSVGGVIGTGLVGVTTQEPALQGTLHDLYGPDPLGSTLPLAMQAWHPYAWAQVMSGTVFVPRQQAPVGVVLGMGATGEPGVHVLDLIRRIRLRVSASAALRTQLAQLTKLIIPVSQDTCPFPSPSSDVKLDAFEELHEPPQTLSPPPVVSVGSRFFKARFSHSAGVDLESIIHVSPEYPTRSPEHFLRFPQHPMRDANQHINHLRAMEREVNAHTNDFTPRSERASTLSYQVLYLEVMLGVYVQTELTESSPGNMVSVRASFGRDRQKPLVFNRTNNVFEERR